MRGKQLPSATTSRSVDTALSPGGSSTSWLRLRSCNAKKVDVQKLLNQDVCAGVEAPPASCGPGLRQSRTNCSAVGMAGHLCAAYVQFGQPAHTSNTKPAQQETPSSPPGV